jgi:hypothetical protein
LLRSTGSKASARVVLEGLAGKAALPTLTQLLKLVQSFIDALLSFSPVHLVYCMETTPSNEAWSSMAINIEATGN